MSPGVGIRTLLLAVNALLLLGPLLGYALLRVLDQQVVRRTEERLIAESVLIGEIWREAWLAEQGLATDAARALSTADSGGRPYFPVQPVLDLGQPVLPPAGEPDRYAVIGVDAAGRAGARVQPVVARATRVNLSAARVLDARGCVVATSGTGLGACLADLPEVASALGGRYAAVLRQRRDDTPGLDSTSRRGRVRVDTALPVLSDGELIGVVRMSRTALDPGRALWMDRNTVFAALACCALLTGGVSLFFSRTIARPLRRLSDAASAASRGETGRGFVSSGFVPAELQRLGSALEQTTAKLSDRADDVAEFAANVSHELKTPITGIRGAAELLRDQWEQMSEDERRGFLANIDDGAARMERLVTKLLRLARIQSAPEAALPLPLREVLAGLARGYDGCVTLDLGEAPEQVRIAPDHLESAVRNLLDNAVRHGAGAPVTLSARREGERVAIEVRDRGPGISPGNRERIFERFFTTERDRGGTGLGLAIVRAVAETRGGRLDCETGPDGTCFRLVV